MTNPDTPPICNYEGSDYQTSFWEQGGRAYEDGAEAVALRRLLPAAQGGWLLDVGAGAGRNAPRYTGYEKIVLLDYSLTQLQQAQQRLGRSPRYIYVAANVYHLPFVAGAFETLVMIRVLHHLVNIPQVFAQIRRVLQPGGAYVLEFANKQNLKAIGRYLLRRQTWSPFSTEPVEFVALNFDFHPRTVRDWLKQAGLLPGRTLTVSHFRMALLKKLLPTGLLVGLDSLAQLTGDWWQLAPSVFVHSQADQSGVRAAEDALLACPACGAGLPLAEAGAEALACAGCGQVWQVRDGIYDLRYPLPAS